MIDSAFTIAPAIVIGGLFLISAVHKAAGFSRFRSAIAGYHIIPTGAVSFAGYSIMAIEMTAGAAGLSMVDPYSAIGLIACSAMLLSYAALIAFSLARGAGPADCGCLAFGARRSQLRPSMIVRNIILAVVAAAAAVPASARPLTWLDIVVVFATVLTAALLYVAYDLVIQNSAWAAST